MARVWADYPGNGGSELLALLALADWSDDAGRCWPSIAAVAAKTRLSRSQAQRIVHGLIEGGFVQVTGNETGGKPGSTRQYQINLGALTGRTDATGSVHATGRTDAQDGSHGCYGRGRMDATQTINEPSLTTKKPIPNGIGSRQAEPDALACPHQDILALYAKRLPTLPQPRVWDGQRATNLKARWRWVLTAKKPSGVRYATDTASGLDFFDRFFGYVSESDFLTGRDGKWGGCNLAWLVKAENFAKVLEGQYQNRSAA